LLQRQSRRGGRVCGDVGQLADHDLSGVLQVVVDLPQGAVTVMYLTANQSYLLRLTFQLISPKELR
jgi:hypothetical protein